ncbi:MAG: COX15/CtaA family protein [Hyphomicrobiaceae bacterium]|nr:COX15/CtaA family protein [Hyphomicrobiaceae bacterium]
MPQARPALPMNDLGLQERGALATPVIVWLAVVGAMVLAMIVVGGATRLTDSGLSITEWQPILGAIPPLDAAQWQEAFDKYRQIPEYALVNKGMSLEEFKVIYWWEWAHRFLGRVIGLAFAVPLAVFWISGRVRGALALKLLGILALGGLQGFFGWYMVQSGLSERVDVSHYRLALHLTTAFIILGAIVWVALDLVESAPRIRLRTVTPGQRWVAIGIVGLLVVQVVVGGFVAGLKAGLVYPTWPLMGDRLVPPDVLGMNPWAVNFVENPVTVQFVHRLMAYVLVVIGVWHAVSIWRTADDERVVTSAMALAAAFLAQSGLGIVTLMSVPSAGAIPIGLGLVHQGGGAVVFAVAVWHMHGMLAQSPVSRARA